MVQVRCGAIAEDSAVARLVKLVQDAQQQRSPTEKMVHRALVCSIEGAERFS
jgi:cation transport ATPase